MVSQKLLERDGELVALGTLVDQLDRTGGRVVLIRGEPGIGKSALVEGFAASRAHDSRIHRGSCDDLFISQPLGPFWDMARAERSLAGPVSEADRPRLLEALLSLLSEPSRPSIMIIEDTQWADEATFDVIKYVGRRIARTNAILILTYRDGEIDHDHPLRGVIGDIPAQNVIRIQLQGLSLGSVASMLGDSGLDPAEVFEATRGNPFLIIESASSDGEGMPSSLADSVMARLRRLSTEAHEMLKTLAIIPEPIRRQDALGLPGVDASGLDECVQRGLLDVANDTVGFRHELIRREIESMLPPNERRARTITVLEGLPEETYPYLLIHCAVEVGDVDRLVDLAPRSARYAASAGSHVQAVEEFRQIGPYLDRLDAMELGMVLDVWAREELLVNVVAEAIRLNGLARDHYRALGDRDAESRALSQAAHYYQHAGQSDRAEQAVRDAIDVLGAGPDGAALARALEVNAYLLVMAGKVADVPRLIERTLEAGGPDIDETVLIRSLNHKGMVANIVHYPDGRAYLDAARQRAETAGLWFEEGRALVNHAWAALEAHDLPVASDYVQRAIASAVRHEIPLMEGYARAKYARVLDLQGAWDQAAEHARMADLGPPFLRVVALPVLGVIEARRARPSARETLRQAWAAAVAADQYERTASAAMAIAEHAWITGIEDVSSAELDRVMKTGLARGLSWSAGKIAVWRWELGQLSSAPQGIAEPYRLLIDGHASEAAAIWGARGVPYERALAMMHGSEADQLAALESFETLGATAVAAKLRMELRNRGIAVPRGKGRHTRRHAAGLTARQAEVLQLLAEELTNTEIADRLFISPRTAEHHVAAVLDKLDVSSRDEAVSRAQADGLVGVSV